MYTNTITLGTRNYDLAIQRTNSSVRRDATQPVSEPRTLSISHETANSGRVASAIIIDDTATINSGTSVTSDQLRVLVKIQYNPFSGRTDINTELNAMLTELVAFLSTPANVTKILNKES